MERRLSPLLAGIGLVGALAWFALGASGRGAATAPDTGPLAADVDAHLRETIAGVQARADTLAQLPRLGLAVATDERTIRDLTTDELAFRTKPGEHIEIAQIARTNGQDGAAHSLLRLPDDKLPLAMASLGPHVMVADGRLQVVVYVAVTPRDRAEELRGAIAVAQAPDLASFAPRFEALGLAGRIEVGEHSAVLAGGDTASGKAAATLPLASSAPETVTLAFVGAPSGGGSSGGRRPIVGPVVLLLLSLAGAALLWRRGAPAAPDAVSPEFPLRPAAAAPTPAVGTKSAPALTPAVGAKPTPALTPSVGVGMARAARPAPPPTPVVGVAAKAKPAPSLTPAVGLPPPAPPKPIFPSIVAPPPNEVRSAENSGTPSLEIGDDESTGTHSAPAAAASGPTNLPPQAPRPSRSRPPNGPARTTTTLPVYLFEVAASSDRPTSPVSAGTPVNEDALGREYRALYVEFLKMRRTCREPIDNLDADRFVAALRKQRDELSRKHGNKEIRFRIAFDNGKAAIRFLVA